MSDMPAVLSATELDRAVIGNTIQVSIVCKDLYEGLEQLVALGIGPFQIFDMDPSNTKDMTLRGEPTECSMRLAFANHENMMWEVIAPTGGRSVYSEFVDAGGTGIHHVAVDGRGLPYAERAQALEACGYKEVQSGFAFSGAVPFAYYHSGSANAPLIEIFDFPEDFAPVADEWYPAPPPEA